MFHLIHVRNVQILHLILVKEKVSQVLIHRHILRDVKDFNFYLLRGKKLKLSFKTISFCQTVVGNVSIMISK